MYDILHSFVDHVWSTSSSASSTEQQIFLYGSIATALLLLVILTDGFYRLLGSVLRKGGK